MLKNTSFIQNTPGRLVPACVVNIPLFTCRFFVEYNFVKDIVEIKNISYYKLIPHICHLLIFYIAYGL